MVGPIQKIKDALTPGHHGTHGAHGVRGANTGYVGEGAYGTDPAYAGNVNDPAYINSTGVSTTSAGTGIGGAGIGGTAAGTGLVGDRHHISNVSTTTSSSDSDYNERMRGTGIAGTGMGGAAVCQAREFVEVEDRPIVKERIERVVEHVPVEKRFVVETRPVAETVLAERANIESLGVTEREIERTAGTGCPTNDPLGNIGGGSMMGGTNMMANECTTCGTAGTGVGAVRREDAVEEMLDGREPLYNVPMKSHH